MQTTEHTHPDTFDLPNHSLEDFKNYVDLITTAVDWAHKNNGAPSSAILEGEGDIIIVSFLLSEFECWSDRFRKCQKTAARFYRDPDTYWRTIALGISTPEVERSCLDLFPNLDREKYFPYVEPLEGIRGDLPGVTTKPKRKYTHKRGALWKLDDRWDHLWPSSRKVFQEIRRRTQYPKRSDNFPWTQTGVESLAKFTGVSVCQVKRALHQLERFGLIKKIFKGNSFLGASKYIVFVTPSMSGAFKFKSLSRRGS